MSWRVQYRNNSSMPPWRIHRDDVWYDWNRRYSTLEVLIDRLLQILSNPACHESWKSKEIEYQFVDDETGEVIPWTVIAG